MEPITALLLLWLVSQATNSGPQTGPDAVKNIRDKGQDVKLLASKTSANAGFAEEIYYSNQGGNVGLYMVWPSNDAASFVVVSVDAAAATRIVTKGTGKQTDAVLKNALRVNAQGNLLPLRMVPPGPGSTVPH